MDTSVLSPAPPLVTLMPCGMATPFNQAIRRFLDSAPDHIASIATMLEGNVNHETSYYPAIVEAKNEGALPDILIASDVNDIFHRPFQERFLQDDTFVEYLPHGRNAFLDSQGFFDPHHRVTMLSANLLVIVADLRRLGNRPLPKSWQDLLDPIYQDSIALRGDGKFFCNAVLLPLYKHLGASAITRMSHNVCAGLHPAQMAKMAGNGKDDGPALFVMPFFFYDKIVDKSQVAMIWPTEGAIPSPVFMLLKQSHRHQYQPLVDFLVSQELGDLFASRGFPFCHPASHAELPSPKLFWVGWDYLNTADVGADKDTIQNIMQGCV